MTSLNGYGVCQCCKKEFKLLKSGQLVDHGARWLIVEHKRRYLMSSCAGSGTKAKKSGGGRNVLKVG